MGNACLVLSQDRYEDAEALMQRASAAVTPDAAGNSSSVPEMQQAYLSLWLRLALTKQGMGATSAGGQSLQDGKSVWVFKVACSLTVQPQVPAHLNRIPRCWVPVTRPACSCNQACMEVGTCSACLSDLARGDRVGSRTLPFPLSMKPGCEVYKHAEAATTDAPDIMHTLVVHSVHPRLSSRHLLRHPVWW
jgi:hypothetical protein